MRTKVSTVTRCIRRSELLLQRREAARDRRSADSQLNVALSSLAREKQMSSSLEEERNRVLEAKPSWLRRKEADAKLGKLQARCSDLEGQQQSMEAELVALRTSADDALCIIEKLKKDIAE